MTVADSSPQLKKILAVLFLAVLIGGFFLIRAGFMDKGFSPGPDVAASSELDRKLNALKLDTDIAYFDSILGSPSIKNPKIIKIVSYSVKRHGRPKKVVEEIQYTEYFYVDQYYFVQALADETGKVGMYSITSRTAEYSPNIQTVLASPIRLGESVFGDVPGKPRKIAGHVEGEVRNSGYYEIFVVDGEVPQLAVFSANPNGYLSDMEPFDQGGQGILVRRFSAEDNFPLHDMHGAFRTRTPFNTYSVVAPWVRGIDMTLDGVNFGAARINFGPLAEQLAAQQTQ